MNRLKSINWNHLYYFFEVARAQSLKEAAANIGIAQSTLSEQLKKLETKFNKKLIHRSSKSLSLTSDGLLLFEKAKNIFEEGSKVLEHFSDDIVGGYSVSIGIEEALSDEIPCEFASQYWDLYTKYGTVNTVRQFGQESLIDNITKGNLDWGISTKMSKRKSLVSQKIGSFKVVFCCSKELFKKFKDPKDILVNIPFFESSWDKSLNRFVYNYLRKKSIIPREKIRSDHFDFIKSLCQRGRCVMFVPQNPLDKYEGLETFSLDDELNIDLYAIWRLSDESLISIRTLKELISSNFSHLPSTYKDTEYQIEVSDVDEDLLK